MLWKRGWDVHADTLLDNLTVEEMLMYTAELKCPLSESLASKREKVASIIDQLALGGCRGVRIGNTLNRGISGVHLIHGLASCVTCICRALQAAGPVQNAAHVEAQVMCWQLY